LWPSTTPKIRVDSTLRPNDESKVLVLSVSNDGRGVARPQARLRWLESEDGQDHSGFVPEDLPWIDVVTGLSHGDEGRVVVLIVDRDNKVLKFLGWIIDGSGCLRPKGSLLARPFVFGSLFLRMIGSPIAFFMRSRTRKPL
jgi:hypothetical protein